LSYRDGRILAAGGRSRFIHLWALDTRKLLRIVEMPDKVTAIKQLVFLPENFDGGASQVLYDKNYTLFQEVKSQD